MNSASMAEIYIRPRTAAPVVAAIGGGNLRGMPALCAAHRAGGPPGLPGARQAGLRQRSQRAHPAQAPFRKSQPAVVTSKVSPRSRVASNGFSN